MGSQQLICDHVSNFKEASNMFDQDGDESIKTKEPGTVMRSPGKNPTEGDVKEIVQESEGKGQDLVDFSEFLNFMAPKTRDPDSEKEIKNAFKVFDKDGHGYVHAEEFRQVLTHLGENLSDEEIEEMTQEANADENGRIKFDDFVTLLTVLLTGK